MKAKDPGPRRGLAGAEAPAGPRRLPAPPAACDTSGFPRGRREEDPS